MALKSIKEVIQNKGYFIDQKDRGIFETGDLRSFFGLSPNDAIEFIIYDVNDNQLPQLNDELVRYIPLNTDNINDYFLIPEGTIFQKYQLPKEYFIDAERLLREAGYDNGIFKTQITLVNKRVGSEKYLDKLWISEISPSRTEVRLYPLNKNQNPQILKNLEDRFKLFVRNGNFREDTINQAFEYIEKVNPSQIGTYLKSKFGEAWFSNFVNEYKIQSFDVFITQIHQKFIEGSIYELTNRISDLNDINYGKPKQQLPELELSSEIIKANIQKILVTVLNKYLLNPNATNTTTSNNVTDSSIDEVSQILQSYKSDILIDTSSPVLVQRKLEKVEEKDSDITLQKEIRDLIKQTVEPPVIVTDIKQQDYAPIVTNYAGGGGSYDYFQNIGRDTLNNLRAGDGISSVENIV